MTNKDYYYLSTIANVLQNGRNITFALDILKDESNSYFEKKKLGKTIELIKSGLSISESLKQQKLISKELISYVQIAEKSPNMKDSFKNILSYLDDKNSFLKKSKEQIALPIIYFSLALFTVLTVKFYGIDFQLQEAEKYTGTIKAEITAHLFYADLFANLLFLLQMAGMFFLFTFLYAIFGSSFNLQVISKIIISYTPILSQIIDYFDKFFIFSLLGQVLKSGQTLSKSLHITKNSISNIKIKHSIDTALEKIEYGDKRYLLDSGLFSKLQKGVFLGVNSTAQLGENLIKLGEYSKEDAYFNATKFFRFVTVFSITILAMTVFLEFYTVVMTQMIIQKSYLLESLGDGMKDYLK